MILQQKDQHNINTHNTRQKEQQKELKYTGQQTRYKTGDDGENIGTKTSTFDFSNAFVNVEFNIN